MPADQGPNFGELGVAPAEPAIAPAGTLSRIWTTSDMVLGIVFAVAGFVVIGVLLGIAVAVGNLEGRGEQTAIAVATVGIEGVLGLWVLARARVRRLRWADLGFTMPARWGPLWVAWAGSYMVLFAYGAVLLLLDSLGVDTSKLQEGNQLPVDARDGGIVLLLLGISVVGLAPLTEELFFRALLYRGMRGYWSVMPSLLASGFLFGLFHQNISVLVPFTLIGMIFAWANEQSKSILISIAAHGAVNALSFALASYGVGAS